MELNNSVLNSERVMLLEDKKALNIMEFTVTVHLFCSVSSLSCANLALRKMAEDNFQFDFEVINTVRGNFYTYDCLKYVPSESEATCLTTDLRRLLERGDFNLTKWVSNCLKLIELLPKPDRAS